MTTRNQQKSPHRSHHTATPAGHAFGTHSRQEPGDDRLVGVPPAGSEAGLADEWEHDFSTLDDAFDEVREDLVPRAVRRRLSGFTFA